MSDWIDTIDHTAPRVPREPVALNWCGVALLGAFAGSAVALCYLAAQLLVMVFA